MVKNSKRRNKQPNQTAEVLQSAQTKKPWYRKRWVWAVVAVFVIIGILNPPEKDEDAQAPQPETTTQAATTTPEPTPTPEPVKTRTPKPTKTKAPEPTPTTVPVADAEALWLSMHGISSPIDFLSQEGYANDLTNPLYAIQPGWGGSTDGYLEIKVQEPLTDDSTKRLGINVLNFIGPEFPDVSGIIFTDSNGIDHNFYRSQAPLANG